MYMYMHMYGRMRAAPEVGGQMLGMGRSPEEGARMAKADDDNDGQRQRGSGGCMGVPWSTVLLFRRWTARCGVRRSSVSGCALPRVEMVTRGMSKTWASSSHAGSSTTCTAPPSAPSAPSASSAHERARMAAGTVRLIPRRVASSMPTANWSKWSDGRLYVRMYGVSSDACQSCTTSVASRSRSRSYSALRRATCAVMAWRATASSWSHLCMLTHETGDRRSVATGERVRERSCRGAITCVRLRHCALTAPRP